MVEASGTTVREVACVKCFTKYAFAVNRKVQGYGSSLYNADDEGAHERATASAQHYLKDALENTVELAPCPNCGTYQPDMVAFLRNAHLKWLYVPAALLILASLFAIFLTWLNSSMGMMIFAGAFFLVGAALIVFQLQAAASLDPNAGDSRERIDLGRRLALFKKDGVRRDS